MGGEKRKEREREGKERAKGKRKEKQKGKSGEERIRGKMEGREEEGKEGKKEEKGGRWKNRGGMCSCDFSVGKSLQQVCVRLPASAVNVTLPAFAAERRAAAPQPLSADPPCSNRSVYLMPAGRTAVNPQ